MRNPHHSRHDSAGKVHCQRMMNVKRSLRYLILFLFLLGIFVPALPSVTAKAEIRLNQSTKSIYVGKYGKLRIVDTETAAGDSYTVPWSSSDRDIVKVSQKGTIKGIAAGTATVTATLKHVPPSDPDVTSDSWHTMVLTCTVTVKPRFYTKDTYTTKTLNVSGDTWTWIPFYFLGAANEKDLDLFCQISDESMIPGGSGTYVSWKWGDWYGKYKNCRRLYLKGKAEGEIRVNVRNSVTNEVINLKATVHAPEEKVTSEKVSFNTNWTYAGNSKIHSGTSTLYHAAPASSKGITVCINAGHGTSGGTSYQTLCHPDGSPKIVSGSTSAGSTYATAIAVGRTFSNGTPERDATLSLALLLKDRLLNAGYDVLMIRETDDVQLDNIARTLMANNYADCHIALHYDSTKSDKGAFFLSVPNVASYRNMEPVKSHWQEHNALGRAVISGMQDSGIKIFGNGEMPMDLTQTSYSTVPSIDLEVGDGGSDISKAAQTKLADGILAGIRNYYP